eukprot:CAMPEP_0116875014 /NCGR_PEP_ID=MMETSP0463-20121206/6716_1 /TAXON_ID=181622 /ORGANISM="Strombidinopsis sp, Strain SopsisLIS2011" /LENGTH=36 /DNA_ID= /DNA_START= /DNA_END= /DNA_ORIENTATION=
MTFTSTLSKALNYELKSKIDVVSWNPGSTYDPEMKK